MAARLGLIISHLSSVPNSGVTEPIFERILSAWLHNTSEAAKYLQSYKFGFTLSAARSLLDKLAANVHTAKDDLDPVFREAYDKAVEGTQMIEGFVKENPVWSTIIALGILAILCPAIIHALGFTLKGVAEGEFAHGKGFTGLTDIPL